MDEHDLMEVLRDLAQQATVDVVQTSGALMDASVWAAPGSNASFGLTVDGTRFVVTVAQVSEDE